MLRRLVFVALAVATIAAVGLIAGYFGASFRDRQTASPTVQPRIASTASAAPSPTSSSTPTLAPRAPRGSLVQLSMSGLGVVVFGDEPEFAIEALGSRLGAPEEDSGWIESINSRFGVCPGNFVRGVRWQHLRVLFTDGRTDYGNERTPHLFAWSYGKGVGARVGRLDLRTPEGIGLRSTVSDVRRAYPAAKIFPDTEGDPFGNSFSLDGSTESGFLFGTLTSAEDDGRVEYLEYGAPHCGE